MNQNQPMQSNSGECPVCHGTGWETYYATVYDYGLPEEIQYARKCPKCKGGYRAQDRTGVPKEYHEADLGKFNFGIYSNDMTKLQNLCTNFLNHFQKWEMAGKGLYLYSKTPGSGKTFLACCLAKSVMMKYDLQMRFVTAPDYITFLKQWAKV